MKTDNLDWGFCGTHGEKAWGIAHEKLVAKTGCSPEAVKLFLDSRYGRQFADDVSNALLVTPLMGDALDAAIAQWMEWTISPMTGAQYGMPIGGVKAIYNQHSYATEQKHWIGVLGEHLQGLTVTK